MEQHSSHKSKLSPGFFFLSLGTLIALVSSVSYFLNLVFRTLDKQFPDVLNSSYQYGYNTYSYEGIRSALAALIILFPVFLILSYFWKKFVKDGSMSHIDDIIRKWMIYLVLFLSSIVVIVDLVYLVRYFISGEITTRFIWKVLVTLVTAGIVGIYYIFELRASELRSHAGRVFAALGTLIVLGAVVYSFSVMGSPLKQRQLRLDDRRVQDLQSLQWQVINYWQQKEKLPATLADLSNPLSGYSVPPDPEFNKGFTYEYAVKNSNTFELCATFSRPMPQGWQEYSGGGVMPMMETRDVAVSSAPYPGGMNDSWDHEAGHTCFERTIDKDLYPPFPKSVR